MPPASNHRVLKNAMKSLAFGFFVVFLYLVAIAVGLGVWFGITAGIAWLVQFAVAGMFAHQMPFWPTFAGVVVIQLLAGPTFRRGK